MDEYIKVTNAIDNIQNKIDQYIRDTEEKINKTYNNLDKNELIKKFKQVLFYIKNNPDITTKYKLLKMRQEELKNNILINSSKSEADIVLLSLKDKYEKDNISVN